MPTSASFERLQPADLRYVIRQLISERKITAERVVSLAQQRTRRITELERMLAGLRVGQAGRNGARPVARAKGPGKPKRKFTMTPKARAARKIQGRYLGMLRTLTGAKRAKVKAVAKKDGVGAAVKLAAKLGK